MISAIVFLIQSHSKPGGRNSWHDHFGGWRTWNTERLADGKLGFFKQSQPQKVKMLYCLSFLPHFLSQTCPPHQLSLSLSLSSTLSVALILKFTLYPTTKAKFSILSRNLSIKISIKNICSIIRSMWILFMAKGH